MRPNNFKRKVMRMVDKLKKDKNNLMKADKILIKNFSSKMNKIKRKFQFRKKDY